MVAKVRFSTILKEALAQDLGDHAKPDPVHAHRVATKRLRALLRLLPKEERTATWKTRLRNVNRRLRAHRERKVLLEKLVDLRGKASTPAESAALDREIRRLENLEARSRERQASALREAKREFGALRKAAAGWSRSSLRANEAREANWLGDSRDSFALESDLRTILKQPRSGLRDSLRKQTQKAKKRALKAAKQDFRKKPKAWVSDLPWRDAYLNCLLPARL